VPHVLHLVTDPADRTAREVITRQAADPATRVSVVLLSDPPGDVVPDGFPGEVLRLTGATPADGSARRPITYRGLLDLIFTADSVVTW
jgi:hypothetical protein